MQRRIGGAATLVALVSVAAACVPVTRPPSPPPPPPLPAFSTPFWTSPVLDGIVQSRPVFATTAHGIVAVVATENDSLYGLDPQSGHVLWGPTSIGTAEPVAELRASGGLPSFCGNLDPVGITSNLVVDGATVYAVGEREHSPAGPAPHTPEHVIVGVNPDPTVPAAQRVTLTPTVIDVAGMNSLPAVQQRAGLVAANGAVYVGFGGLAGDCGDYHGWVVAVNESDGSVAASFEVAPDVGAPHNRWGAVWGTSGPVTDAAGNVYASTGNGAGGLFSTPPGTDYTDGVVKLTRSAGALGAADYFQPDTLVADNQADLDLGSTGPLFVSGGTQLFQLGKRGTAYLLDVSSLGGANHQTPVAKLDNVCGAWGGNDSLGTSVYAACLVSTVRQIVISGTGANATMHVGWVAPVHVTGPVAADPAAGLVWSVDVSSSVLYGLNAATGQVVVRGQLALNPQQHFPTPRVAGGIVMVANDHQVTAFAT